MNATKYGKELLNKKNSENTPKPGKAIPVALVNEQVKVKNDKEAQIDVKFKRNPKNTLVVTRDPQTRKSWHAQNLEGSVNFMGHIYK